MGDKPKTSCGNCKGFNYCFWAKLLVAIPAIPLVAFIAASLFIHPLLQILAAAVAVFGVVWAAVVIDRMPAFSRKFRCK